jgi:dTDP-4-amino-4,6-dideoxygalactose transaminase
MSCGEGGGLATSDAKVAERARCTIDPCHFYWQGRSDGIKPFAGIGARASELMGAMLNVQLDRLDGMIAKMRKEKKRILAGTKQLGNLGLKETPMNSPDHDCSTQVMYLLPDEEAAVKFTKLMPSVIAGKTGRHTFTQWDQVLMHEGAHHQTLNPYKLPENRGLRLDYPQDLCKSSLDILNRTVMVATSPLHCDKDIDDMIHNIDQAARYALDHITLQDADIRGSMAVDYQKFDSQKT